MISVVVPVYNVAQYLDDCVNSIVNQTYSDLQIILVDDGSTDDSGIMCDAWANKDKRIEVVHKQNGGLSSARNAGLNVAKGDYVGFVDSDDVIDFDMYSCLYNSMMESQSDIVSCSVNTFIDGDLGRQRLFRGLPYNRLFNSREYIKMILQEKIENAVWSKLFRRETIGNHRFIEGKINEDFLFFLPILIEVDTVFYVAHPFYKYRMRAGSITRAFHPKTYDFVHNALDMKSLITTKYPDLSEACEGYVLGKMADYMALVVRFGKMEEHEESFLYCINYIKEQLLRNLLNPNWSAIKKMKFFFIDFSPVLYIISYNFIKRLQTLFRGI